MIDCERYVQHSGKEKCLGIFRSTEAALASLGDLGELSSCLYGAEGVYAGKDPAGCVYRGIAAQANVRKTESPNLEPSV